MWGAILSYIGILPSRQRDREERRERMISWEDGITGAQ